MASTQGCDTTPLATAGTPEIREYRIRAVISDVEIGDYSDTQQITVRPVSWRRAAGMTGREGPESNKITFTAYALGKPGPAAKFRGGTKPPSLISPADAGCPEEKLFAFSFELCLILVINSMQ